MKQLLISLLISVSLNSFGQNTDWTPLCEPDTVVISEYLYPHGVWFGWPDSSITYKALKCSKNTYFGLRMDIGVSQYRYNSTTKAWLGNHGGPSIGFAVAVKNWNVGFRFKPWTVNPHHNLIFNNDTLTGNADLNPVKLDYYLSYSFNFKYNLSLEPYLGYSKTVFAVINEDEIKKQFNIPTASGLIAGVSLIKYIKLKEAGYLGVFANWGFSNVNYTSTHESLGRGYSEFTIGVLIKSLYKRHYYQKIL